MMRILYLAISTVSFLLCTCSSLGALEWQPALLEQSTNDLAVVPFTDVRPTEAQLQLLDHEHPSLVYVWSSIKGLHIEIEVADAGFEPRTDKKWLWKGDCVYLEIDGHGDNPTAYAMGHDDIKLFFALSADGAQGKISDHGHVHLKRAMDANLFAITFNAAQKKFFYRITVPWNLLNSAPGLSSRIAMAVNVAHKGASKKDNVLGKMGNKKERSRGLIQLRLDAPKQEHALVAIFPEMPLLSTRASVRIPVAISSEIVSRVSMRMGKKELVLPFEKKKPLRGWIKVDHADLVHGSALEVHIDDKVHACKFLSLQEQHTTIMQRLAKSDLSNSVSAIHIESLKALATDCMSRSAILHHNDPKANNIAWLTKIFKWQRMLLKSLPETGFDLKQHLAGGKPIALAFVAEGDGSLQFASLQLPHDFNPDYIYSLVCYLHGYGPKKPVDYLVSLEDNSGQDTLWLGGSDDKVLASAQRSCIILSPFGRGSTGYANLAERDVWQALAITQRHFKIDENRRYITGFSMGCDGAFSLAAKRPDYWAAVNLSAGFHGQSSCWDKARYKNLRRLPLIIWCGDKDTMMYPDYKRLLPILEKSGIKPAHTTVARGLPHTYPYYSFSDMLHQCFKFMRTPTDSFSYRLPVQDKSSWRPQSCHGFQALLKQGVVWEDIEFAVTHHKNTFSLRVSGDGLAGFDVRSDAFGQFAPGFDSAHDVIVTCDGRIVYQGALRAKKRILLTPMKEGK